MTNCLENEDLLARLVGFDSVSRNSNLPLADFVADYLDRPGVRLTRNPSADGTKANLVVSLGPDPDPAVRDGLVLSGHMDVVPADEPQWKTDPFVLTRRDTRLYGRGACDMKGFLAIAMNAAAALEPATLRHPLVLLFTYDEELGTLGAQRFVETWTAPTALPRHAVIGEPTTLRAVRMHKGYLKVRVTLTGVPAHSGYPHLGRNAIEPMGRVIVALSELRAALEQERPPHHEHFPEVPYAPLNLGIIHGGAALNIVPDRCVLELGVRLLPDMSSPEMIQRVRDAVLRGLGHAGFTLEAIGDSPPMLLAEDAAIHRSVCAAVEQQATHSVSFATDAGWLSTTGMECVIFGPGSIAVAHKPNEYLPVQEFDRAARVVERLIAQHCRSD